MSAFAGADNAVDNCLVADDLRSRNRSFALCKNGVNKGAYFALEEIALFLCFNRNGSLGEFSVKVVEKSDVADGTVPCAAPCADIRLFDLKSGIFSEEKEIAGGVHMHCPAHPEIKGDAAFEADKSCAEIVNFKVFVVAKIFRVLTEMIMFNRGNGQRFRYPIELRAKSRA